MKRQCIICLGLIFVLASAAYGGDLFSTDVFVGGFEGYPVYRIPAMVTSNTGTILAFCEGRKTGIFDHGNIDLVLKRSFDHGRTWGPLQVIESKGFQTWGNPAPVVDRSTGRIWLPFCLNNNRVFVTYSDDEGASWAERREITQDVKLPGWAWYATGPGHALQLSTGRLLIPCDHSSLDGTYSHLMYSDDHGLTWQLGGILDRGTNECMAMETADDTLYLTMRNLWGKKRRAYARSDDGGLTWSESLIAEDLVCPTCQAGIIRLPDLGNGGQDLVFFINPASTKRQNISIRLSLDQAQSWSAPRTIHAGPGAYSDLVVLPGPGVGAIYENGRIWPYSKITFTELPLEWITGK